VDRLVVTDPAYDRRAEGYGIHGCSVRMVLKNKAGAVQFLIYSNRQLPHVQEEFVNKLCVDAETKKYLKSWSGPFTEGKELEEIISFQKRLNLLELKNDFLIQPLPADLGYHSPGPMYEGQEPIRHIYKSMKVVDGVMIPPIYGDPVICPYLEGDVPCYYDGSGLNAQDIYKILIRDGIEAVWAELKDYHESTFGEENENAKKESAGEKEEANQGDEEEN
jgi:hypothetical protein